VIWIDDLLTGGLEEFALNLGPSGPLIQIRHGCSATSA
jgi:hypothetical protein